MGRVIGFTALGVVLSALTACGGNTDDGGANAVCSRGLSGGSVVVEAACTGCKVSNPALAADGSKLTAATLAFNAADGSSTSGTHAQGGLNTVRATGPGSVYPAGSLVGAYMKFPTDNAAKITLTFVTYSNGVQQESLPAFSVTGSAPDLAGTFYYYNPGTTTTKPFDALETQVEYQGVTGEEDVSLYEMCASY